MPTVLNVLTVVMRYRYGVPGTSARRFEEVMRTTAPQRFEQDRDLLHHLTTLTPPTLLMNNGKNSILVSLQYTNTTFTGVSVFVTALYVLTHSSILQVSKWFTLFSMRVNSLSRFPRHITVVSAWDGTQLRLPTLL